jgi:type II secretory pathway component PulF
VHAALLRAGAAAGDVAGALEEVAEHVAAESEYRSRLRAALAHPIVTALVVLVVGVGTVAALAGDVLALSDDETWADDTEPARWPLVAAGFAILVAYLLTVAVAVWRKSPLSAVGTRRLVPFRGLRLAHARASLASTLHLLLRRAVPLPIALDLAARTTASPGVAERVRRMATAARDGAGLTASLRTGDVMEPSLLWLVEAADGSASAADALGDVAAIYRQRVLRAIDRLGLIVRPFSELVVGAAVFLFALGFTLPVADWLRQLAVP